MAARNRFFLRTGMVLGALMVANPWGILILSWFDGHLFAYANYWGAPIGTITLAILLTCVTPVGLWACFRYWNWSGGEPTGD